MMVKPLDELVFGSSWCARRSRDGLMGVVLFNNVRERKGTRLFWLWSGGLVQL